MSALLGVDCGGTRTKLVLTDPSGREVLARRSVPTPRGAAALGMIIREAQGFARSAGAHVGAVGVSLPGILDPADGTVLRSTNLTWLEGERPAARIADALGVPGAAVQDGAASAMAEALLGAGRDRSDVFVLALGTGVAGAHVVDGEVRRGAHGAAGEVGHLATGTGELCSCGQRGCLETEIGGARLGARFDEVSGRQGSSALELIRAAQDGDEAACGVLDRATDALARVLLSVVALIDPDLIVIGGGLAESTDWIVDPARRKTVERATFHVLPPVVQAELGPWAGAQGAALSASEIGRLVEEL